MTKIVSISSLVFMDLALIGRGLQALSDGLGGGHLFMASVASFASFGLIAIIYKWKSV